MGDDARAQGDVAAVILAGGRSSRMGTEKAALTIGGMPLLRRVALRLAEAMPAVLVVGPETLAPLVADVPGAAVVPDRYPGQGPLGGLLSAFAACAASRLCVVACDMPFVAPALVAHLMHVARSMPDADVVAIVAGRDIEPLHAVYARSGLGVLEAGFTAGERSLRRCLARMHVVTLAQADIAQLDPAGRSAFNANTPSEWAAARQLADDERG